MQKREFTARTNETTPRRFESDTQKIVRRHLENQHDIITEEDIRGIRVGLTPPFIDPNQDRTNLEERY